MKTEKENTNSEPEKKENGQDQENNPSETAADKPSSEEETQTADQAAKPTEDEDKVTETEESKDSQGKSGDKEKDSSDEPEVTTVSLTQGVEIIISGDKLSCEIKINKDENGAVPTKDIILQELKDKDIQFELIDNDELNKIYDEEKFGEEVLIAKGKPQKDGEDGYIKYNFKTEASEFLQEDEKGRVDFKEISFIQQFSEGDVLAELIPPTEGTEGMNVIGEKLLPEPGQPAVHLAGLNTSISKENKSHLVANVEGAVSIKNEKVTIEPVVVIEGDVDYSTGNIDFKGPVLIKGSVKSGFKVKSKSDITVEGVVEDAEIESGGRVELKGGFIGKGNGKVVAESDVLIQFAENQNIISKGNVIVNEALLHCNVISDRSVDIAGNKGAIGGAISALESIELQSVGSQTYTKTRLIVGMNHNTRLKIKTFNHDRKTHNVNTNKVKHALGLLSKIRLLKRGLTDQQEELYNSLSEVKDKLTAEVEVLKNTREEIKEELKKAKNAKIIVHNKINPGVTIEFGEFKKTVQEESPGLEFMLKDDQISAIKKKDKKK
ncbi:DUF342 domain-containing protein [candidate division KSB1 bacterium]